MKLATLPVWPQGQFPAQRFCDESERLRVIASYGLDHLHDDDDLRQIAQFAARLCSAPIALVSLVEDNRQVFLARSGTDIKETPRSMSFCAHAMLGKGPMIIRDALENPLFADNPLVTGEPFIRFYAGVPLVSQEGAPLGALCVIDDKPRPYALSPLQMQGMELLARSVTQRIEGHRSRRVAADAQSDTNRRFETIIESLPDITWSANTKGEITYINRRWTDYTGLPSDDYDSDHIRMAYHPDEIEPWRKDWLAAIQRAEPYEGEYRLRRKDGTYGWILARAMPLRNKHGEVESWFGQLIDIDERRQRSQARDMLARELAHRIKNIFSVIGGLVNMRSRGKDELKPFASELLGTIHALGRAQDFVKPLENTRENDLHRLLDALMAPYNQDENERVVVRGEGVKFGPNAATSLALIFHEIATNAAKYGALSKRKGRVEVVIAGSDDAARVTWRESGGPRVKAPPEGAGFGSRLIDTTVRGQLGGDMTYDWLADGVHITISLPHESLLR